MKSETNTATYPIYIAQSFLAQRITADYLKWRINSLALAKMIITAYNNESCGIGISSTNYGLGSKTEARDMRTIRHKIVGKIIFREAIHHVLSDAELNDISVDNFNVEYSTPIENTIKAKVILREASQRNPVWENEDRA